MVARTSFPFLSYLLVVYASYGNMKPSSAPYKMIISNIETCDVTASNPSQPVITSKNVDSEGHKSFSLKGDLNEEFNENTQYIFQVDKFTNGEWNENVYSEDGKIGDVIRTYVDRSWKRLKKHFANMVENYCDVKKGHYEIVDYQVPKEEVNFPPMYGSLKATLSLLNDKDEVFLCVRGYLEVTEH
ncbi:uncharacterized protein LOC115889880 [Sitophilus oryzae]|uniref:Uncharacterized protein LOC115889880 n=1 Tax=Sitophilus oryzae TaxID=7048 RepID=A0A6J2YRB8_SITOR|nr:uncharacterized protein LOC115889880 [Sitophilus oryzae]